MRRRDVRPTRRRRVRGAPASSIRAATTYLGTSLRSAQKNTVLYPELFKAFEEVRWTLRAGWIRTIGFDVEWEKRVVGMSLKNLSSLFGQTFESVQQLNRFRKSLAAA